MRDDCVVSSADRRDPHLELAKAEGANGYRAAVHLNDRSVNAIVFTAVGDKAFCTGGNTKEYAEYYAGNPGEYKQYMRPFNDMVTSILLADKPVVCRVNGMRVGGGQEVGMACDFSIAQDLARFGQAGPRHGSAADGGATDFLPLFVGIEQAMVGCTLCEPWSAHQAYRLGVVHENQAVYNFALGGAEQVKLGGVCVQQLPQFSAASC